MNVDMKNLNTFLEEATNNDLINETRNDNVENFPNVRELGNGKFKGALWGHCFLYEGNKYYAENGIFNIYPSEVNVIIDEDNVLIETINNTQKPELIQQFK